ncbi:MAG: hypothetical protein H0X65_22380 [Gemmatimonadetes bacterium]|nr:hypothetical protein [Gemmatimonadota bacterium]
MRGAEEIVPAEVRQSAIISHSIGIPELTHLLDGVPADAKEEAYEQAALEENVLALATETGRRKRFASLRRLYLFRPDSVLFRSVRDLWAVEAEGRPLLAALCAMATDTVFRASAEVVVRTAPGEEVTVTDFREAIEAAYPGVYAASTLQKAADNAYASWQQSGHLGAPEGGRKRRQRVTCRPADVAYALLLGHLQGARGEALFDTVWTRVLDQPRSQLYDLAFAASQRGMLEYRNAGGVVEVGFRTLLRPLEGELL